MSSTSSVAASASNNYYIQKAAVPQPSAAATAPKAAQPAAVGTDADGDNDGTKSAVNSSGRLDTQG